MHMIFHSQRLRGALVIASLSLLQACGSSDSNYSATPINTDNTAQSGSELYKAQCVSCHGETGNGNTPITDSRPANELATYIANNMPKGNIAACDTLCADKISDFILGGYGVAPTALSRPSFKLDWHEHGNSYKVLAGFSSLQWTNDNPQASTIDSWQWLYTRASDTPEHSSCDTETCLSQWQPLVTAENEALDAPFSKFERSDSYWQVSLYGMPLYTKTSASNPPLQNSDWPVATSAPTQQTNNWLMTSGLLNTQGQNTTTLESLSNRSLYIKTSEGECAGMCLDSWPSLLVPANLTLQKPYGLKSTQQADLAQLTYQGQALHLFSSDSSGDSIGADIIGWQRSAITPIRWSTTTAGNALVADGPSLLWTNTDNGWESQWKNTNGYSLYTFANDGDFAATPDTAMLACNASCAEAWPPLMAHANSYSSGKFGLVARGNGWQWSWNGKPLYLHAADTDAGLTIGHNAQGPWTLAGWQATTPPSDTQPSDNGY